MPTHFETQRFMREYLALSDELRSQFRDAARQFREDLQRRTSRPGLRVKRFRGRDAVYEMSWGKDHRALRTYGDPVEKDDVHIIWLRIGTHDIFRPE